MGGVTTVTGNIFASQCQSLVNTVNCVGAMGAGLALECRLRYPEMYLEYQHLCSANKIRIGRLWVFESTDRWIINFPTKLHWKAPTEEAYLHAGLTEFVQTYTSMGVQSAAFPLLGARHGGIPAERSLDIMLGYLERCAIPIEVYIHHPDFSDPRFVEFRTKFLSCSVDSIRNITGLGVKQIQRMQGALSDPSLSLLSQLLCIDGLGMKTIEASFRLVRGAPVGSAEHCQHSMFT